MTEVLNKAKLTKAFYELGIRKGMALEVHSSLSSFGFVEGGAEAVIDALIECVGEDGSIFMPSLCLSDELELTDEDKAMGITSKIKVLPENATKTAMGIISDTFRQRADVMTGSGIIRTSGWGKNAKQAVTGGLDYVIHNGGKALMLGVDIYKLTAMHYVENLLPQKINDIFAPSNQINEKYPPDKWFIEAGTPPVKAWYTIQDMAYRKGIIKDGYIGKCKYMFFDVWDVVSIYKNELENNPLRLYGLE